MFNLRKTHSNSRVFDVALVVVVAFGLTVAWLSFRAGGAWIVLGILALVGEALVAWGVFVEEFRLVVTSYRERLVADPKAWIKIAFVSDLHAGAFHDEEWYGRVAREIQAHKPDVILLGGDYVAERSDSVTALKPFGELTAPLGKFFVLGNHDYLDRPEEVAQFVESLGFQNINNRSVKIVREDREFELHGLDDQWFGKAEKFVRRSKDIPYVTLAHEPDTILDLKEGDTDLVISGHTHGGQVRLPLIGALWPIPTKLGRSADRGRKIVNGVPLIVSVGAGEMDGRFRLFCAPEVVIVEIGI